jgi:hypothetical protein
MKGFETEITNVQFTERRCAMKQIVVALAERSMRRLADWCAYIGLMVGLTVLLGALCFVFIIGACSVFHDWRHDRFSDPNGMQWLFTDPGMRYFLVKESLQETADGHIEAVIVMKLEPESVSWLFQQAEAKDAANGRHVIWGIERVMQFDFKRQYYRVVAHRLINDKREAVIVYDGVDEYWQPLVDSPKAFKILVGYVERRWLIQEGAKGAS